MSTELLGILIGVVFLAAQAILILGLAKIMSFFSDKILPDEEEQDHKFSPHAILWQGGFFTFFLQGRDSAIYTSFLQYR